MNATSIKAASLPAKIARTNGFKLVRGTINNRPCYSFSRTNLLVTVMYAEGAYWVNAVLTDRDENVTTKSFPYGDCKCIIDRNNEAKIEALEFVAKRFRALNN